MGLEDLVDVCWFSLPGAMWIRFGLPQFQLHYGMDWHVAQRADAKVGDIWHQEMVSYHVVPSRAFMAADRPAGGAGSRRLAPPVGDSSDISPAPSMQNPAEVRKIGDLSVEAPADQNGHVMSGAGIVGDDA